MSTVEQNHAAGINSGNKSQNHMVK